MFYVECESLFFCSRVQDKNRQDRMGHSCVLQWLDDLWMGLPLHSISHLAAAGTLSIIYVRNAALFGDNIRTFNVSDNERSIGEDAESPHANRCTCSSAKQGMYIPPCIIHILGWLNVELCETSRMSTSMQDTNHRNVAVLPECLQRLLKTVQIVLGSRLGEILMTQAGDLPPCTRKWLEVASRYTCVPHCEDTSSEYLCQDEQQIA